VSFEWHDYGGAIVSLTKEETAVEEFLKSHGFSVKRIPEAPTKGERRPDFMVACEYVVEIKSRRDPKFAELLASQIPDEKPPLSIGYKARISSIVKDGVEQLISYEEAQGALKILWFFIDNPLFGGLIARQIVWTLYGLMELEGYTQSENWYSAPCFYFTYNEFYKYRQLDAVFIQGTEENVLCINEFSGRYDRFHTTAFYQRAVREEWVILDPRQMERESKCFTLVDCDVSRKDHNAVLDYIAHKYNLRQVNAQVFCLVNYPLDQRNLINHKVNSDCEKKAR
jgi:Holliday junction resolvase